MLVYTVHVFTIHDVQALIGDKYGYRPIPSVIDADEFNKLSEAARVGNDQRWTLVSNFIIKIY